MNSACAKLMTRITPKIRVNPTDSSAYTPPSNNPPTIAWRIVAKLMCGDSLDDCYEGHFSGATANSAGVTTTGIPFCHCNRNGGARGFWPLALNFIAEPTNAVGGGVVISFSEMASRTLVGSVDAAFSSASLMTQVSE